MPETSAERARVAAIQNQSAAGNAGGTAGDALRNATTVFNAAPITVPGTNVPTALASTVVPVRGSGRFLIMAKVDGVTGAGFVDCELIVNIQHNGAGPFNAAIEGQVSGVAAAQGSGSTSGIVATGFAIGGTATFVLNAFSITVAATNTLAVPGPGTLAGAGATLTVIELPI